MTIKKFDSILDSICDRAYKIKLKNEMIVFNPTPTRDPIGKKEA
jgi:hypothetical protein